MKNLKKTIEGLNIKFTKLDSWDQEVCDNQLVTYSLTLEGFTNYLKYAVLPSDEKVYTEREVYNALKEMGYTPKISNGLSIHLYVNILVEDYEDFSLIQSIHQIEVDLAKSNHKKEVASFLDMAMTIFREMQSFFES